ncbi:MAG: hypothetical protein HY564_02840 [Candidatus Jacksonbacteria bacterium]|nr:hypothetical protein [Candidatus Jacksonbacteria bacterium]
MLKALQSQLRPLQILFAASLLVNLFVWLYTYFQYRGATDLAPLHYTIYFGIDLIDDKTKLFAYPIFGITILALNSLLSLVLRTERLIGYILLGSALVGQILIALAEISLVVNYY